MHLPLSCYEPPLNVTREPGSTVRFFVRSEDRTKKDEHYLVDMDAQEFPLGWCECAHYDYRIEPKLSRGLPAAGHGVCKHARAVATAIAMCRVICEYHDEPLSLAPLHIPDIEEYQHHRPAKVGYRLQA